MSQSAALNELDRKYPRVDSVGFCCLCGNSAAWNTPHVSPDGKLYCNHCAYKSKVMLKGVAQWLDCDGNMYSEPNDVHHVKDHCLVWCNPVAGISAYTDDGCIVFQLTAAERLLAQSKPEALLDLMIATRAAGRYRCQICGKLIDEKKAVRHLYAGLCCPTCNKTRDKRFDNLSDNS